MGLGTFLSCFTEGGSPNSTYPDNHPREVFGLDCVVVANSDDGGPHGPFLCRACCQEEAVWLVGNVDGQIGSPVQACWYAVAAVEEGGLKNGFQQGSDSILFGHVKFKNKSTRTRLSLISNVVEHCRFSESSVSLS
jgi:hypothetical protein